MPKALKRDYTQERKDEGLHWYRNEGPSGAARRLRIPSATIKSWARAAGIQPDQAIEGRKSAVEMATLTRKQKREAILDGRHDKVIDLLDRMDSEQVDCRLSLRATSSGYRPELNSRIFLVITGMPGSL